MSNQISITEPDMGKQATSTLFAKLESIAKDAPNDEVAWKKLYDAAQSLTTASESPADTIQRIAYLVSVICKSAHH